MREIKFRAFNAEEKEMIFLSNSGLQYFDFEGNYSLGFTVDGYDGFWGHERYSNPSKKAASFPIMQFTGLHDKNGKEIYEGDVLKLHAGNPRFIKHNVEVVFMDGAFCTKLIGYQYSDREIPTAFITYFDQCDKNGIAEPYSAQLEVIGNIYENPELITPKTD